MTRKLTVAIDVGNTKTAIGFFQESSLIKVWHMETHCRRLVDEYRLLLNQLLFAVGESFASVDGAILASVVPSCTDEWDKLKKDMDLHVVTSHTKTSFDIAIEAPHTLGADRIADLEAAVINHGAPVLVVDAGTATTLSVVDHKRRFIGGTISPGVGIASQALFQAAASLQEVQIRVPTTVIGNNTSLAIQSGICYGHAALIEGLIHRIFSQLEDKNVVVVATGGAIDLLAPCLDPTYRIDPHLTMTGLRLLYQNMKQVRGNA